MRYVFLLLVASLIGGAWLYASQSFAWGAKPREPEIKISEVKLRPRTSSVASLLGFGDDGELYMQVLSDVPDTLINVHSAAIKSFEFRIRKPDPEDMSGYEEREAEYIRIIPYENNPLSYYGPFVLLKGIKDMPEEGKKLDLTLEFQQAGKIDVVAEVVNPKTSAR